MKESVWMVRLIGIAALAAMMAVPGAGADAS
jgi:hypothetical protein